MLVDAVTVKDVTREYTDVEIRLRVKHEEEARLREIPALATANVALDHRFSEVRNDATMKEILTIVKKQLLEEHK